MKLDEFEVFGEAILQNAHNVHKKAKKINVSIMQNDIAGHFGINQQE